MAPIATLPRIAIDATGSALGGGAHLVPVGTPVRIMRDGILQWEGAGAVVHRHDRNRTYRLRFDNETFVTVYEHEIVAE